MSSSMLTNFLGGPYLHIHLFGGPFKKKKKKGDRENKKINFTQSRASRFPFSWGGWPLRMERRRKREKKNEVGKYMGRGRERGNFVASKSDWADDLSALCPRSTPKRRTDGPSDRMMERTTEREREMCKGWERARNAFPFLSFQPLPPCGDLVVGPVYM